MIDKVRGIVIGSVPYAENAVILRIYTDQYGLLAFMVNGVRSRKGTIKPSQIQLLNLLELDISFQQSKSLQRIKDLKVNPVLNQIHFDIRKGAVAMFIAELVQKCMKAENQKDEQLFEFLFHIIQFIDIQQQGIANLPVYFLVHFTKYLGFAPAVNYSQTNSLFSLKEGIFVSSDLRSSDCLDSELSQVLNSLMQCKLIELPDLQISKSHRHRLLEILIRYYGIHLSQFSEVNAHKILATVF